MTDTYLTQWKAINPESGVEYETQLDCQPEDAPFMFLERTSDGWIDENMVVWARGFDGIWRHA